MPDKWFQAVIEDNYHAGLRFFARCFDRCNIPWDEIERFAVFYSSDDYEHFGSLDRRAGSGRRHSTVVSTVKRGN